MALLSNRLRLRENHARSTAGEVLWVDSIGRQALIRLDELWTYADQHDTRYFGGETSSDRIVQTMRFEGGHDVPRRLGPGTLSGNSGLPTIVLLDLIEAIVKEFREVHGGIEAAVNAIFDEHRVGYRFIDGELVARSADELHREVVEPAARLLVGKVFASAHSAYLKALKELTRDDPADAITDAGTALQETLVALGCTGNALGPLIKDAKKRGLLASHDQTLTDAIEKFAHWASADRSETGDAHSHSSATKADAWLMVHVVGALIVRLTDSEKSRGSN